MPARLGRFLVLLLVVSALTGLACRSRDAHDKPGPGVDGEQTPSVIGQAAASVATPFASTSIPVESNPTPASTPSVRRCDGTAPSSDKGLYRMSADGSGLCLLIESAGIESNPVWSPSGAKIAFVRFVPGNFIDVFVMDADGANPRNVSNSPDNDSGPAWVPGGSGEVLAFVSGRNTHGSGAGEIFTVDLADPNAQPRPLNSQLQIPYDLEWSPDGDWVAFSSNSFAAGPIYVAHPDGTALHDLTGQGASGVWPAWSPDGRKIAFVSNADASWDIFVSNLDGSYLVNLTRDEAEDRSPAWSPDSRQIVFSSRRDGDKDIYVMNADGTGLRQLTDLPGDETDPAWSPDGRWIVFSNARGLT